MKRNILTSCALWALTVVKEAITQIAVMAILSVLAKTWTILALTTGGC
ncbi:hypothetical protein [Aeromonas allosaccharophila]